jgi:hypothetical protein
VNSAGVAFVLVATQLRLVEKRTHLLEKLRDVDWVGASIFVISCTAFLVAISWGGIQYKWTSAATLVPLIGGAIGLGLFVVWEIFCPVPPLVPLGIFTTRGGAVGYAQIAICGGLLWTLVYYLPLYFQVVKGYSELTTSVSLFPETLLVAPVAVVTGIVIEKSGKYRNFLLAGWATSVLGSGVMILLNARTTVPQWIFINMVLGAGQGLLLPAMQFSVQAACRDEDMAFAAGMVSTMRTFGQALALPIFGTIFQAILKKHLEASPLADRAAALSQDAFQAVVAVKQMRFEGESASTLVQGFQRAVRACFIGMVPASAIGLLFSCFSKDQSLDRVLYTEHGVDHGRGEPDQEAP